MRRGACCSNATTARNGKKPGVANTWQAASIVAEYSNDISVNTSSLQQQQAQAQPEHNMQMPDEDDDEASWISYHPLGSDLIHSM